MKADKLRASFEKEVAKVYADEFEKTAEWLKKYGTPRQITEEEAANSDPNYIWTEWMASERWINNGFEPSANDINSNISSFYLLASKPWTGEEFTQPLTTEIWLDCPVCQDDDFDGDDCEFCEDEELIPIAFWDF